MAKYKVLIVEDEVAIARMVAMNLRVANYDVTMFHDGREAAEHLQIDAEYDIALLDVMLPGMDGFALMEVMKENGIPVIFLTAKDDLGSKIQGLRGGAEDYLVKPFEVLELLVRMEKVLARNQKTYRVEEILNLEIDFEARTVKKAGAEVALKPLEFDLLAALVKKRNIAVSREWLLQQVWGGEYEGETRTVDVHVGQLRKKLDLHEHIKTVSKLGYRLEV